MKDWNDLAYWKSDAYKVVEERLNTGCNPRKEDLFKALAATPFDKCKVMFVGQDPYPDSEMSTGLAFSVPGTVKPKNFPPTLACIFKEYSKDLHYDLPQSGDLTKWTSEGVLLWNAYPSCKPGESLSHKWVGWEALTKEIVEKLDAKDEVVFVFFGKIARRFAPYVKAANSVVIETSHPSPRASLKAKLPFLGSRVFTTVNDHLTQQGLTTIDWRL